MTFRKLATPDVCPEGYDLHMYCDHENDEHSYKEFPQQFFGRNKREANSDAREAGWRRHTDGTATCPKCMARKKIEKPEGSFRL